jgi:hypothetical protein
MPIPATTSVAHLRDNLDAQDVELSRADIQSINSIAPEGTATRPLPSAPEPASQVNGLLQSADRQIEHASRLFLASLA